MSSKRKKIRVIHIHFRDRVVEIEMEKNLHKWEGNNKMWKKFLKSVKSKFKLKTSFAIYDPNDDMFVDDMDDLCGCYIGYEADYTFILSLHVKADKEPWPQTENKTTKNKKRKVSATSKTKQNGTKSASDTIISNTNRNINISAIAALIPDLDMINENMSSNDNDDDLIENMSELQLKPMEEIKAELGVSRRKSRRLSIDFGLFDESKTSSNCEVNTVWLDFGAARIKNCDHLNRLISGLNYYSNLEIFRNDIDKDEFNNFFDDIYVHMLDDYLHLLIFHENDLEEIYESLQTKYHMNIHCNIRICPFIKRHFNINCNNKNDDDPWINFYIQTYDSLHFLLFHLFDIGLKSFKKEIQIQVIKSKYKKYNYKKEEKKEEDRCYDKQFAKIISIMDRKKKNTNYLKRYHNVNKYALNLSLKFDEQKANLIQRKFIDSERLTFKDSLMFHLQKTIKQKLMLQKFNVFINSELYDSDAIVQDIDFAHGEFSNICKDFKNKQFLHEIKEYIKNTKLSSASSSFSIGLIFYYWPYYKKQENVMVGAYKQSELYIEMRHDTFKQEILNYGSYLGITIWEYNNLIVLKAKQYQQTRVAKVITVKFNPHLHFDVDFTVLTRENMVALVLYADFEMISKEFASTFRQIRLNESLQSIKSRNQKYWWLSKTLRETVQYFGVNGSPAGENVQGPFYTCVSSIMNVPEFNITLCSPVSTSKQLEVVMRFNDNSGIIIQLNNNGDYESGRYLRSFNIGWISKYKEEKETLFIGGDWKIRIETIKIISTKQNFHKYFDALFLFDCMCNGYDIDDHTAEPGTEARPISPTKQSTSAVADFKLPLSKQKGSKSSASARPRASSSTTRMPSPTKATSATKSFFSTANSPSQQNSVSTKNVFSSNITKIDEKTEEKSANYKTIRALIDNKLGIEFITKNNSRIPRYIINSFNTFCREKKVVTLNLFYLNKNFQQYTDLIMNEIEVDRYKTTNTPWMPNPYSNKNTLKLRLFSLFDNINKLVIYSTKYNGFPSYSFSLMSFLSSVEFNSTFTQIIIKATWDEPVIKDESNMKSNKRSWIHTMFYASPLGTVKSLLKQSQCQIFIAQHKNNIGLMEDWLVIDRE